MYIRYSRINKARINFYVLLIYLYREKKKAAKNGFSACYIELYIEKENSLPNLTGNKGREREEGKGRFTPSAIPKSCLTRHCRE